MVVRDPGYAEQLTRQFIELTVELSHVESYSHELSMKRALATYQLHEVGGLSYEEISDLYTQRGATVSCKRVQQLAERGAARMRLKADMNDKVSRDKQDTISH